MDSLSLLCWRYLYRLYPYRWHTFLHIAGAVVFLGNIIVTAAWMLMAERTRSVNVIHFSAKAVIRRRPALYPA